MPRARKSSRDVALEKTVNRKAQRPGALDSLREEIRRFALDRDWEKFHSPKNLSMALMAESAELLEHFLWLTEKQSRQLDSAKMQKVAEEIGDVLIYLIRISDQLGIDPLSAAQKKVLVNAQKYPVRYSRGNAKKYTEFKKS